MKKLLTILAIFATINSFSQGIHSTTTLPSPVTSFIPSFRYYGSLTDSLRQTWMATSTGGWNRIYTATELNKYFFPTFLQNNNPTILSGNLNVTTTGLDSSGIYWHASTDYAKIFFRGASDVSSLNFLLGDNKVYDKFKFQIDTNNVGTNKKIVPVFYFNLDTANLFSSKFLAKNIYQNGNQVANDNAVVHNSGTETGLAGNKTWTGTGIWQNGSNHTNVSSSGVTSTGYLTGIGLSISDASSTGNYASISSNGSDMTSLRFYYPSNTGSDAGHQLFYHLDGSGLLTYGKYYNFGTVPADNGIFRVLGTLQNYNQPINPYDAVNRRGGDSLYVGKAGQWVNITWFGAIADYDPVTDTYTTDNTSAIQAAINSLPNGAGTIYIPNGKGKGFAFTGTIYRGQGTRFLGDNAGITTQNNPTDTINYKVASLLRYKGTGTALAFQTTANYRNQFPVDENYALIGNGRTSANVGILFNSNPSYITPNPNSKDIGLVKINHVYVDGFKTGIDFSRSDTYYLQDSHISNTHVAVRGGKQDGYIFNNCFFANDTTMYNHAGLALDIHNNEVEPSGGIGFVGDSINYSSFHDNKYKNIKTAIILKNKGSANSIHNETVLAPLADAFIVSALDDNNSILNNTVTSATARTLYIRQTNKLFIQGNVWAAPISGSTIAAQIDTCTNLTYVNNYDNDYGNAFKLSTTGSVGQDISDFNTRRVWGSGNYNSTASFATRYSAGTLQSPTAVGSSVVFGTFKGEAYNGSSFAQTANVEFQTTESQTGSAGGSRINFNVTPSGSTTRSTRAYVDGNGLSITGASNAMALVPGTASTADNLQFKAVNSNKNSQFTLIPSGTATGSKIVLQNSSASSNFGTAYIGASGDSVWVSPQDNGTASTPLRNFVIGASAALGGVGWTNIVTRSTNLVFNATTKIAFNRSIQLPLTGLLKGNGASSDVTAISGTSSQFVMGDGSLTTTQATVGAHLKLTASGNGTSTTISIAHGLTGVTSTSFVNADARSAAAGGWTYITTDATNINFVYATAPVTGTNNLSYNITIIP